MSKAEVCIVESLNFLEESSHREGEILSRTLRLSGKGSHYTYLRTKDEFRQFVVEFGDSRYRYLHVSCHGNDEGLGTTLDFIPNDELVDILAPAMKGRRLFLSSCLTSANENGLAATLLARSECLSVIAPEQVIRFDDAAIFWSCFYHLMFKEDSERMQHREIEAKLLKCSELVGESFTFYYRTKGKIASKTYPS